MIETANFMAPFKLTIIILPVSFSQIFKILHSVSPQSLNIKLDTIYQFLLWNKTSIQPLFSDGWRFPVIDKNSFSPKVRKLGKAGLSQLTSLQQCCFVHAWSAKVFFSSCHEREIKKEFGVSVTNRTSNLRVPHYDALPLSHRDSTVSKAITKLSRM